MILPSQLYSQPFFEDHKPIPNIILRLNGTEHSDYISPPKIQLDHRFILPFLVNAPLLKIRQIALCGNDPVAHPCFREFLDCFSGEIEMLSLWIKPGGLHGQAKLIAEKVDEIVFFVGPYIDEHWTMELSELGKEATEIKRKGKSIRIRVALESSAVSLINLKNIITLLEEAGADMLEFFPANLYISPERIRLYEAMTPECLPDKQYMKFIQEHFWEILEDDTYKTRLFNLQLTRRQLKKVFEFFDAAQGKGMFHPPFCRASRTALYVEPTGEVRCCPFQKVIGNLWKSSILEIAESQTLGLYRANLNTAKNPLCPVCPGVYPHLLRKTSKK